MIKKEEKDALVFIQLRGVSDHTILTLCNGIHPIQPNSSFLNLILKNTKNKPTFRSLKVFLNQVRIPS